MKSKAEERRHEWLSRQHAADIAYLTRALRRAEGRLTKARVRYDRVSDDDWGLATALAYRRGEVAALRRALRAARRMR